MKACPIMAATGVAIMTVVIHSLNDLPFAFSVRTVFTAPTFEVRRNSSERFQQRAFPSTVMSKGQGEGKVEYIALQQLQSEEIRGGGGTSYSEKKNKITRQDKAS